MATLFSWSALQIIRQALAERRAAAASVPACAGSAVVG